MAGVTVGETERPFWTKWFHSDVRTTDEEGKKRR